MHFRLHNHQFAFTVVSIVLGSFAISGCSHKDNAQESGTAATARPGQGTLATTANVPPEAQQFAQQRQTLMQSEGAKHKAAERPAKP